MDITQKSINYLKSLIAETISNANSGHTGSAISASTMMLALFHDHLKFDPTNPNWANRDRFVLSAGHTSAMYYSLLHLFGYDISIDDLKHFRKCHSKTPGHPEKNIVPGVEVTTGPLGQGVANAVGMAIASKKMSQLFPNSIDNKIYCYSGDGCLMEGVAVEACSLAGTLALDNLVLLYEDNNITIDGARTLANAEDTARKFDAMGWNVLIVKNGHDYISCTKAIEKANKSNKPVIVIFKTIIGIGTSKQGTPKVHAYPLPKEELEAFKQSLEAPESFYIPEDVYAWCREQTNKNIELSKIWHAKNKDILETINTLKPAKFNFEKLLKTLNAEGPQAGRDISSIALNALAENYYFFGGTADVGPSTKAVISKSTDFSAKNPSGRNIHFGIREHAMGSICNGIAATSNFNVFDSTFLAFSNYMIPSLKMRGMMNLPVLSVFTHDSVDIGEDGPTHQPIEQISQLRSIIGLDVIRPANTTEVVWAFKHFVEEKRPTALIMSKSKLMTSKDVSVEMASCGGYVLCDTNKKPTIQIISTGKDVELALSVANEMSATHSVRVISMPCEKLFASQNKTYKNSVLLKNPELTVVIEASNDTVWHKYTTENDLIVSVQDYQTSGKGAEVYAGAGFSKENILKLINKKLK